MLPTIFSIGNFAISSFGVFLAIGFLYGIFLIWRLARAWDLSEEKVLDLTLLTFLGGLIGARLYYVLEHILNFAQNPLNFILITKFPGFSFWGAILGGWLMLYFLSRRLRQDFLQIADIASVGFLAGLIFESIGCFFGGCAIGIPINSFLGVSMVGVIGKRWPVQLLEALLFVLVLKIIWSKASHFHIRGKIVSLSFVCIGLVKLLTEPLRQNHTFELSFSVILIILGVSIFYKVTRKNILKDTDKFFRFLMKVMVDQNEQKIVGRRVLFAIRRSWYNMKVELIWKLGRLGKIGILRRLNVKLSHKSSKYY